MTPAAFIAWREQMGFNQEQAARAISYSVRAIRYWEGGRNGKPVAIPAKAKRLCNDITRTKTLKDEIAVTTGRREKARTRAYNSFVHGYEAGRTDGLEFALELLEGKAEPEEPLFPPEPEEPLFPPEPEEPLFPPDYFAKGELRK